MLPALSFIQVVSDMGLSVSGERESVRKKRIRTADGTVAVPVSTKMAGCTVGAPFLAGTRAAGGEPEGTAPSRLFADPELGTAYRGATSTGISSVSNSSPSP
jgi:hypothetical protein